MAGSLNHIVAEDGSFTMDLIESMGDAHEALEECHAIIAILIHYAYRDIGEDPTGALIEVLHQIYPGARARSRQGTRCPILYRSGGSHD